MQQTDERRAQLFGSAITGAQAHRLLYRQRCKAIADHHQQQIAEKQSRKQEKDRADLKQKEQLCQQVQQSGLWSSPEDVASKVAVESTAARKIAALKTQIRFRKIVLQQKADKRLFQWSAGGRNFSVTELQENLVALVTANQEHAGTASIPGEESSK